MRIILFNLRACVTVAAFIFTFMSYSLLADDEASDIVKVKGRGVGEDRVAALKDACRDAVERAVGLYVDAEQQMENDQVIKDRVLTQSNAYIENYAVKSERKIASDILEVVIIALVKKQELTKTLRDAMPEKTFSIGEELKRQHQKLVDEKMKRDTEVRQKQEEEKVEALRREQEEARAAVSAESQRVRDEKAARLLSGALDGFNPYVTLLDVIQDPAVAPKVLGGEEDTQISFGLRMRINSDRYFNVLVPRIKQVLGQISIKEPRTVSYILEPVEDAPFFCHGVTIENAKVSNSIIDAFCRSRMECDGRKASLRLSHGDFGDLGRVVWLITSFQKGGNGRTRVSMTGYELANRPMEVWNMACESWESAKMRFKAELISAKKEVVTGLSFSLKTKPLFMGWGPALCGNDTFQYYLTPMFFEADSEVSFSDDDEKQVKNLVRNCGVSSSKARKAYLKAIRDRFRGNQAYLAAYKELNEGLSKDKKRGVASGIYQTVGEEDSEEEDLPCSGFEIPLSCTFNVLSEELEKISTVRVRVFEGE